MSSFRLPIVSPTFDSTDYRIGLAAGRLNTVKELAEVMVSLGATVDPDLDDHANFARLATAWVQVGAWAAETVKEATQQFVLLSNEGDASPQ